MMLQPTEWWRWRRKGCWAGDADGQNAWEGFFPVVLGGDWGKRERESRERGMGPLPQMAAVPTNTHNNQIKSALAVRAGDSRGVALAVKLIDKKMKE